MKFATLEKLREYQGQQITVVYRAVRKTFEFKGKFDGFQAFQSSTTSYLVLITNDATRYFYPNHIVKITTEDGKEWF